MCGRHAPLAAYRAPHDTSRVKASRRRSTSRSCSAPCCRACGTTFAAMPVASCSSHQHIPPGLRRHIGKSSCACRSRDRLHVEEARSAAGENTKKWGSSMDSVIDMQVGLRTSKSHAGPPGIFVLQTCSAQVGFLDRALDVGGDGRSVGEACGRILPSLSLDFGRPVGRLSLQRQVVARLRSRILLLRGHQGRSVYNWRSGAGQFHMPDVGKDNLKASLQVSYAVAQADGGALGQPSQTPANYG